MSSVRRSSLIRCLSRIDRRAQFAVIHQYRPTTVPGKLADYNMVINVDYRKALKRSLEILSRYNPNLAAEFAGFDHETLHLAKMELIESLVLSLDTPPEDLDKHYQPIIVDGRKLKAAKLDPKTGIVHLWGFFIQEKVYQEGFQKLVNSAAKTLAKKYLRNMLPIGRFVQFRLTSENCNGVKLEGVYLDLTGKVPLPKKK